MQRIRWHFATDCRVPLSCDATRPGPYPDPLRALGLDRASLDAAWDGAVERLRTKHGVEDADAMLAQAAANLSYWRANPAPPPTTLDEITAVAAWLLGTS